MNLRCAEKWDAGGVGEAGGVGDAEGLGDAGGVGDADGAISEQWFVCSKIS